jgi:hypothetical protein
MGQGKRVKLALAGLLVTAVGVGTGCKRADASLQEVLPDQPVEAQPAPGDEHEEVREAEEEAREGMDEESGLGGAGDAGIPPPTGEYFEGEGLGEEGGLLEGEGQRGDEGWGGAGGEEGELLEGEGQRGDGGWGGAGGAGLDEEGGLLERGDGGWGGAGGAGLDEEGGPRPGQGEDNLPEQEPLEGEQPPLEYD